MTKALPLVLLLALSAYTQPGPYTSNSYTEAPERPKTAAELRAELLDRERGTPSQYLTVEAKHWRNLIGQLVIEGDVANQATLVNFKDPVLSVTWYSKTNTELETKTYPVYELVQAQHTRHCKRKTEAPGYVATVALGIADATPVE
jgi:hypothetical protein